MKYVFIGGTYRGYKLLETLLLKNYVPDYLIILQEDEHEEIKYSSEMELLATNYNIIYSKKKKITTHDIDIIKEKQRDLAVVCGWRTLIPITINKYFKIGMVAAHDSLLPKYRGFAPLNWAIINGEKYTGVTLFLIQDGEVDSGEVLSKKKVKIEHSDYAIDVYEKITQATISLFLNLFNDLKTKSVRKYKQNELNATYTCKRCPDDGRINWDKTSLEIYNFIRALAPPYTGAFCYFNTIKYVVTKAELGKMNDKKFAGRINGRVIAINEKGIEVLCGSGSIYITMWKNTDRNTIEIPSKAIKSISTNLL